MIGMSLYQVRPGRTECTLNTRLTSLADIWFHRYKNGVDIEGRFDYNSWQESDEGLALAASLPKDTVIAEGRLIATL